MPLDALLKKYFAAVLLLLAAVAAYFQARGTSSLVGARLAPNAELLGKLPPAPGDPSTLHRTTERRARDAEPILARNPFDSVTGPLNAVPVDTEVLAAVEAKPNLDDPLAAPPCDGVKVNIVTESTDPLWSLAAIQGPGEPLPALRRVGDDVKGRQVAYIGYNWREGSPAVWLTQGAAICQALVFSQQPVAAAAGAAPVAPSPAAGKQRGAPGVPKEIADKIQRVSDTEYNVDRAVVDKILENQADLMRSARIVPEQKDGKVVGIRMFGIRPETLLGHLGFQNGDRLETINGFDMTSPEKALEAYARLRTAQNLSVKINRRGQPLSVDFKIK